MGQPMHATAPHPRPPPAADDDDEWEYEYDEHATEDLYFTLDLTTHVPNALVREAGSAAERYWAQPKKSNPSQNAQQPDGNTHVDHDSGSDSDSNQEDATPIALSAGRLQLIDLHTTNPLVKLDSGVYSCFWSTDIGTQFHVAKAGTTPNPRRPGTVLDVVGTSQARLIGKPATLKPRDKPRRSATQASNAISINDSSDSDRESSSRARPIPNVQALPGELLKIDRDSCRNPAAENHASFLERFSAIKLKRGETDIVPVYNIRTYNPPDNIDEVRQKALAADEEKERRRRELAEENDQQRERRKRRRLTNAEKGIPDNENAKLAGRQSYEATVARLGIDAEYASPSAFASAPSQPSQTDIGGLVMGDATRLDASSHSGRDAELGVEITSDLASSSATNSANRRDISIDNSRQDFRSPLHTPAGSSSHIQEEPTASSHVNTGADISTRAEGEAGAAISGEIPDPPEFQGEAHGAS